MTKRASHILLLTVASVALMSCTESKRTVTTTLGGSSSGAKPVAASPKAAEDMGDRAMLRGDAPAAITFYSGALRGRPSDTLLLTKFGFALFRARRYVAAETVFDRALSISPDDGKALRGKANALVARGRPQDGIPVYLRAINKSGRDADHRLFNGLGVAHDNLGQHREAQQAYRKGLAVSPSGKNLRNNLALSLSASGDHRRAVEIMEKLVAGVGGKSGGFKDNLDRVRQAAGKAGAGLKRKRPKMRLATGKKLDIEAKKLRSLSPASGGSRRDADETGRVDLPGAYGIKAPKVKAPKGSTPKGGAAKNKTSSLGTNGDAFAERKLATFLNKIAPGTGLPAKKKTQIAESGSDSAVERKLATILNRIRPKVGRPNARVGSNKKLDAVASPSGSRKFAESKPVRRPVASTSADRAASPDRAFLNSLDKPASRIRGRKLPRSRVSRSTRGRGAIADARTVDVDTNDIADGSDKAFLDEMRKPLSSRRSKRKSRRRAKRPAKRIIARPAPNRIAPARAARKLADIKPATGAGRRNITGNHSDAEADRADTDFITSLRDGTSDRSGRINRSKNRSKSRYRKTVRSSSLARKRALRRAAAKRREAKRSRTAKPSTVSLTKGWPGPRPLKKTQGKVATKKSPVPKKSVSVMPKAPAPVKPKPISTVRKAAPPKATRRAPTPVVKVPPKKQAKKLALPQSRGNVVIKQITPDKAYLSRAAKALAKTAPSAGRAKKPAPIKTSRPSTGRRIGDAPRSSGTRARPKAPRRIIDEE